MFDVYDRDEAAQSLRRLFVASPVALAALATIAFAFFLLLGRSHIATTKKVEVVFRPLPRVEPKPLPPPPKPKVAPTPKPQAVAAAPAPLAAPKEIPKEKPPESNDVVAEANVAVHGKGDLAHATATSLDTIGGSAAPINLPEYATPPVEDAGNAAPEYPQEAKSTGTEGMVILKVVVEVDGSVGAIQVMRGQEPFVASALAAVKKWHYQAAQVDGQPIAVFRIIKIPFRIKS